MTAVAKEPDQAFQQPRAKRVQLFDARDVDDNVVRGLLLMRNGIDQPFQRAGMSCNPWPCCDKGYRLAAGGECESRMAHGSFLGRKIPARVDVDQLEGLEAMKVFTSLA